MNRTNRRVLFWYFGLLNGAVIYSGLELDRVSGGETGMNKQKAGTPLLVFCVSSGETETRHEQKIYRHIYQYRSR